MCGICGFIGEPDPGALKALTASLAHRGPDAEGFWSSPNGRVHFGHRRLSVVDLGGGAQPMHSWDGRYSIVFNGEIYNHRELRLELEGKGARFQTHHSDTEVLLEAYRTWGANLQPRLNGMWAFAIFDSRENTLFLSRDRFGKKPLYYFAADDSFVFASELRSLRHHPSLPHGGVIDSLSLQKYYAYGYIPAPRTIWKDVYKLEGGYSITLEVRNPRVPCKSRYWSFALEPQAGNRTREELAEELRHLLSGAVARRLEADVPVGVFLSGGVDSSAVAAFAAKEHPSQINAFTIGFMEPSFDERAAASSVARHLGLKHHVDVLSMDTAHTRLPDLISKLDEPMADSSLLPSDLLSGFARSHVTVALSGDGADELFAGYDPFHALSKASLYRKVVPRPIHGGIEALVNLMPVSHRNMSFDFKLKRTLRGLSVPENLQLPTWMAPLTPPELADLFEVAIDPEAVFSEAIQAWERAPQDPVAKALQFYTDLYLRDDILAKVDRASMLHGLEVRSPFLDIEVVNFVRRLPVGLKYAAGETKVLLKQAVAPLLPDGVLSRPKKGFGVPIGAWFKSGSLGLPAGEPLNRAFSQKRLESHRAGKRDERAFLWADWVLGEWRASLK